MKPSYTLQPSSKTKVFVTTDTVTQDPEDSAGRWKPNPSDAVALILISEGVKVPLIENHFLLHRQ